MKILINFPTKRKPLFDTFFDEKNIKLAEELGEVVWNDTDDFFRDDVLREKIMMLCHKNKKDRKLSWHEREALTQYYKDYKAMNGNSYIDRYYSRMSTWAVDEDDYEDDE